MGWPGKRFTGIGAWRLLGERDLSSHVDAMSEAITSPDRSFDVNLYPYDKAVALACDY